MPPPSHNRIEVYALLWLTKECEGRIRDFFLSVGVPIHVIQRGMHLSVYRGYGPLSGLSPMTKPLTIRADVAETRFMVLAPGGEEPRPGLDPAESSVGIRLTRRNSAIPDIQKIRRSIYELETPRRTKKWTSCLGASRYQPHIKLLLPGNGIERDMKPLGESFRSAFHEICFGKYEVKVRKL